MNDVEHLTEDEIAVLEVNFPHQPGLSEDQYEAWLQMARIAYDVITAQVEGP